MAADFRICVGGDLRARTKPCRYSTHGGIGLQSTLAIRRIQCQWRRAQQLLHQRAAVHPLKYLALHARALAKFL